MRRLSLLRHACGRVHQVLGRRWLRPAEGPQGWGVEGPVMRRASLLQHSRGGGGVVLGPRTSSTATARFENSKGALWGAALLRRPCRRGGDVLGGGGRGATNGPKLEMYYRSDEKHDLTASKHNLFSRRCRRQPLRHRVRPHHPARLLRARRGSESCLQNRAPAEVSARTCGTSQCLGPIRSGARPSKPR